MKKVVSLILLTMIVFQCNPSAVYAISNTDDITFRVEEDLYEIKYALSNTELRALEPGKPVVKQIQLDNQYVAIITLMVEEAEITMMRANSSIRRTLTSKLEIKNVFNSTIATLKAIGVFDTNGITSKPYNAYGTSSVNGITNVENVLGSEAFNSWVRVSLSGILPGSNFSMDYKCTINCDANGKNSVFWQ